jgi:L-ribulose-5-phosphate 3-epimerase
MKITTSNKSRRTFLKKSLLAGSFFPLMPGILNSELHENANGSLKIHVFSKHLQFLNYREMAAAAAEIGFDGVDLTVRPKGHVLPERVENDLPKAVKAIKNAGLAPVMMTTAVQDANNPVDRQVLETAAKSGVKYYRMGYFHYLNDKNIPESIQHFQQHQVEELNQLNEELGIIGSYQNHAGNYIGANIWELWELLKNVGQEHLGVQYDIRHAVVEGGLSWQNGLRLIEPFIKTLALKDFKWEKKNGSWRAQNTPIGEGMVDFKSFFQLLKKYNIQAPVSLHLEYPIAGAEHGATKLSGDKQIVFNAMKRDLQKIQEMWQDA